MHSNDKESKPEIRAASEKFQRLTTGWEAHQWIDILNQPALGFAQTPREAQLISPKKYNNLESFYFWHGAFLSNQVAVMIHFAFATNHNVVSVSTMNGGSSKF